MQKRNNNKKQPSSPPPKSEIKMKIKSKEKRNEVASSNGANHGNIPTVSASAVEARK